MSSNVGLNMVTDGLVFYNDYSNTKCYISGNTTCDDLSINKNTDSISGCTYSGNSLYFNGSSYVKRTSALNTGDNFTVSIWMRTPLADSQRRSFVGNSYNYFNKNGWFFSTGGGGAQEGCFFLSIGNDTVYKTTISGTILSNQWYYLSGVVQSGGSSIKLYRNNEEITLTAAVKLSANTITYTYPQFNIGYRNIGVSNEPYTGNIALVQIYNRILSQQEITQNFNATRKKFNI
jgi:hypothetical protein